MLVTRCIFTNCNLNLLLYSHVYFQKSQHFYDTCKLKAIFPVNNQLASHMWSIKENHDRIPTLFSELDKMMETVCTVQAFVGMYMYNKTSSLNIWL